MLKELFNFYQDQMKGRGHKAEYEFEYETFLWGMVF
jgi:hypothetical protein